MDRYIVAVRRDKWDSVSLRSAIDRISKVPNVQIIGDLDGPRTVIETTKQSAKQIEQLLRDCCYVEAQVAYMPQ